MKRCRILLVFAFALRTLLFVGRAASNEGGWVIVPFPIYTPETDGAMTLTALRYFRLHEDAQTSSIMASGAYSLNQQATFRLAPSISLFGGKGWFDGDIAYEYWPDEFYGVGHNTPESAKEKYTSRGRELEATVLRKVYSDLSVGMVAEFRHYDVVKKEQNGLLDSGIIAGSHGAEVIGAGLVVVWDRREDRFAPAVGSFIKVAGLAYYDRVSEKNFQKLVLDFRQFYSIPANSVLAMQQYATFTDGQVPFQEMSRIGDIREISLMRGYYTGRYLDNNLIVLQGEWRYPISNRLSGTLFAGVGAIGDDLTRSSGNSIYPSGGAGLRYRATKSEKINLRLDVAIGKDSGGVYFGLMEAF